MDEVTKTTTQPERNVGDHGSEHSSPKPICRRCGGFLVTEHCTDLLSSAEWKDSQAMRCVQCGDVIDAVILRHRQLQDRHQSSSEPAMSTKMAYMGVELRTGPHRRNVRLSVR